MPEAVNGGGSMVRAARVRQSVGGVGGVGGGPRHEQIKEDMEVANDSRLVMDNNDDVKAIEAMGKHRILGRPLDLFILAAFLEDSSATYCMRLVHLHCLLT